MKNPSWVPIPNSHDGAGYTQLIDHENGMQHFCVWILLVQIASKCRIGAGFSQARGTLLRGSGEPYDAATMARKTRTCEKMWLEALPRIAEIGWIDITPVNIDDTGQGAVIPQEGATEPQEPAQNRTEQNKNRTEQEQGAGGTAQEGASCSPFTKKEMDALGIPNRQSVKLCFALANVFAESVLSWNPAIPELHEGIRRDTWMKYAAEFIWQLIDTDKRPEQLIRDVLEYLPTHERKKTGEAPFKWRNSTLTGRKLFDNFEQIRIAMVEDEGSDAGYQFEPRP